MSDTTNDTRTQHAEPDQPAQLVGPPASVLAHLITLTADEETTAAELALAADLGRSTTSKALTTLEKHGLAIRTPGGHDGPRRTPDRWRAAPTPWTSSSDGASAQDATPTDSEPSTTHASESQASRTDDESALASATTTNGEESSTDGEASVTVASGADAPHDTSHQDDKQPAEYIEKEADAHDAGSNDGPEPEDTPEPDQTNLEQPATAPAPATAATQLGERKRLAPGALRQLVIDHLRAHPDGPFTATKISRVIEKSSGAIANALDKLVKEGIAEQMSDRPRTYRLATPDGNA